MTSMKTIAIAQIRKNFSRYFNKEVKIKYEWNEENLNHEDDDIIPIQTESDAHNPLNESRNVDFVNNCSSSECNNGTIETDSNPKTLIANESDQFQLSFDRQKENENIVGVYIENENCISQGQQVDPKNSTEDLVHVVEADRNEQVIPKETTHNFTSVVETDRSEQVIPKERTDNFTSLVEARSEQVTPKETTHNFTSLVDFWTGTTADNVDGTIENLILALQTCNSTNQPSSPVKVTAVDEEIERNNTNQELCHNFQDELNDYTDTAKNIDISNVKDNETAQTFGSIQNTKECSDKVGQKAASSENGEHSSIGQKQVEPNDETMEIHSAVDVVKGSTTLTQEVNKEAEESSILASENVADNGTGAEDKNVAENDKGKTVDIMCPAQDKQQTSESHTALNEPFVFDFENNITSANYGIIYEVVQDPNDPTLFSLQAGSSTTVTNLVLSNEMFAKCDLSTISWKFDSSGELTDQQKQLLPPCVVLIKDCLVRKRRASLFDNTEFFQPAAKERIKKPKARVERPKQQKVSRTKPKKIKTKTEQKIVQREERKGKDEGKKKRRIVILPPSPATKVATKMARHPVDVIKPTTTSLPTLDAEKNSSINDWLQESSRVASPLRQVNNVDVDQLLQDANLFISSDIEDDAYQLAAFLETLDQPNNGTQNVASASQAIPNVPQQQNNERSWDRSNPLNHSMITETDFDQPLDLSMKQTTPTSNDTGFGSYRSSKEVEIGLPKDKNDANTYTEYRKSNPVYANQINQNYNLTGNSLKRIESVDKPSRNLLTPASTATSNIPCEPNHPVKSVDKKRKLSPVNFSLPKKKTRTIAEPIAEFTLEEETPKQQCILQPLKPLPSLTDFGRESIDYETDLDYEPSEDETEDVHEKSLHDENKISDKFNENNYSSQSTDTTSSNERNKKWEKLLIKLPNNINASSRVVVFAGKSTSSNANADSKTCTPSTPINIVGPLQPIISPTPKSKTFTVTVPGKNFPNIRTTTMTQAGINPLRSQMLYLFNRPCFKYLNGRDCGVGCNFNHELPPVREIIEKMKIFSNDTIMYMYSKFIVMNKTAFITYFPAICDLFGSKQMESSLVDAIKDCSQHDKVSFLKFIYEGLVKTELSKRDALTKIIDNCAKNKQSYNVVIEIMIEADALYFVEMLNDYFRLATISSHHMLKLLRQVMDNPAPSLLVVFIDMLHQYSISDVCDIGTFKLLLSKSKQLAVEDITIKKRLNEIAMRRK